MSAEHYVVKNFLRLLKKNVAAVKCHGNSKSKCRVNSKSHTAEGEKNPSKNALN